MAITTSENLGKPVQQKCARCGHPVSLAVLDPNGRPVHDRGGCPDGPAPVEPGPVIGHDPLDTGGSSREVRAKAIGHIQSSGANLMRENASVNRSGNDVVALVNPAGREDSPTNEKVVHPGAVTHVERQGMRPVADLVYEAAKYDAEAAARLLRRSSPLEPLDEPA